MTYIITALVWHSFTRYLLLCCTVCYAMLAYALLQCAAEQRYSMPLFLYAMLTRIAKAVLQPSVVPLGLQPGIPSLSSGQYLLYSTRKSLGPTCTIPVSAVRHAMEWPGQTRMHTAK